MPRRRRKCLAQASTQAPVLPAETKAWARPSATARTPTTSEASRRLMASRGSSAMPIASVAWRMAMCSGLYETPSSTFWMRRSSPTSRHSMSVASETWATPCTTASGAWSPPMASTAMVGMLGVRPGNHGERGERAGERERQAQRRPMRGGARDARRELVAAGGRSEQPSRSAAAAALPRIVRRSRHDYPDGLLDLQRADARLPVPPVERPRRERGEVHAVEAADVHVDAIGVEARHVEARHAAVPAEEMARRHGAEPVARELRLAGEQAEAVARHDQVEVGLLRADGAVALTHARQVGRHLVAHAPAVAAARVGSHGARC